MLCFSRRNGGIELRNKTSADHVKKAISLIATEYNATNQRHEWKTKPIAHMPEQAVRPMNAVVSDDVIGPALNSGIREYKRLDWASRAKADLFQ
jgi:hypothetical protein